MPKLNDFVEGLKILLKPEGVITLEFPHILKLIDKNQFDTIIHTAAITSIRHCEEDKVLAWKTNVDGTKNVISAVQESQNEMKFVCVSTKLKAESINKLIANRKVFFICCFFSP